MQIEEYFNFLAADDIRIKGTRIGIESVLYEHIHRAQTPEQISERFQTLTLEQVYATILYYLQNPEEVGSYLADYLQYCQTAREEYEKNLPSVVARLRELRTEARDNTPSATPSPSQITVPSTHKKSAESVSSA